MRNSKPTLFTVAFLGAVILSGCVQTVQQSSTMYVRDLVQSDVFAALPENGPEIIIYESTKDIQGEYLELASVHIEESASTFDRNKLLSKLQQEAFALGGNALLLVEEKSGRQGRVTKSILKGIAIFTLDEIPGEALSENWMALSS